MVYSRGETYRVLGHYEAALTDLDRAIELDPHLGIAFTSRAQTYEAMGRHEAANADFNRADELGSVGLGRTTQVPDVVLRLPTFCLRGGG